MTSSRRVFISLASRIYGMRRHFIGACQFPFWVPGVNPEGLRTQSQCSANDRFAAQGAMAGHGREPPVVRWPFTTQRGRTNFGEAAIQGSAVRGHLTTDRLALQLQVRVREHLSTNPAGTT